MNSLLFVVRAYSTTGAQPNRFKNLHKHLQGRFKIHVLELTHGTGGTREEGGITIHSLEYSSLGKLLNPERKSVRADNEPAVKNGLNMPWIIIKKFLRYLLFPDSVVSEAFRMRLEVRRLVKMYGFRIVIVSAFPFTTLFSIGGLHKIFRIKTILDVGDPFYKNSKNGALRDFLAMQFEKYYLKQIDALVVTNSITKTHYLKNFSGYINPNSVHIVEQGVNEEFVRRISMESSGALNKRTDIQLVYAGQLYRKLREPFKLYDAIKILNKSGGVFEFRLNMYGTYNKEFYPGINEANYVNMMGQVSSEEIVGVISKADIVVFIDNAFGIQTPGKIYELALLKKHVLFISDNVGSPASLVAQNFDHIHFTRNKPLQIAQTINQIINTDEVPEQKTLNESFFWESRTNEYAKIFDTLLVS